MMTKKMSFIRTEGSLMRLSVAAAVACLVATGISAAEQAKAAVRRTTNIEAGGLAPALQIFAKERGVQIVYRSETVGNRKTSGVSGDLTLDEALTKLLNGTGLTYRYLDEEGITIISVSASNPGSPATTSSVGSFGGQFVMAQVDSSSISGGGGELRSDGARSPQEVRNQASFDQLGEIVVSARKRDETLIDVPQTVNVVSSQTIADYNIQSFTDYAALIPNLSFSVGGASGAGGVGGEGMVGTRAILLRGILGNNTTNVYIDDVQVDATQDPRIVDVERIEVLKGPQGTLFGGSSLGGTVRVITKQPNLQENDLEYMIQGGGTLHAPDPDYGANVKGNAVVVPDRFAVRSMAFVNHDSGFITRTYRLFPYNSANQERVSSRGEGSGTQYGGSVTALFRIADNLDLTARLLAQWEDTPRGWPAVFSGLSKFDPESLVIDRNNYNLPDTAENHWYMPSLKVNYRGAGFEVVGSISQFKRASSNSWDISTPMAQAVARAPYNYPNYNQPVLETVKRDTDIKQYELRLSTDPWHGLSASMGGFFSRRAEGNYFTPRVVPGLTALGGVSDVWLEGRYNFYTDESALFAELYYSLNQFVKFTAGVRYFEFEKDIFRDRWGAVLNTVVPNRTHEYFKETGVSPKFGFSVEPNDDLTIYGTASNGFRPGGNAALLIPACAPELAQMGMTLEDATKYKSDSVWSYELGAKKSAMNRRLFGTVAVFQTNWSDIQQTVRLGGCSVSFTGNAGAARIRGVEAEINGSVTPDLTVRASAGYLDAVITDNSDGRTGQAVGSRIYSVPRVTANAGLLYARPIADGRSLFISNDWSYVGDSLSANSGGTANPQIRGAYLIGNARVGIRWEEKKEVSLYVNNITNELANYGDMPNGVSRTIVRNGQVVQDPRVAISRPLQVGLQFKRGF
ncbi:MAG: TonB-dependent receptor [Steroidobacteraceae bacterium]